MLIYSVHNSMWQFFLSSIQRRVNVCISYFKIILIDYFTTRLYDMVMTLFSVMIKTLSVLGQVYLEGGVPCLKM